MTRSPDLPITRFHSRPGLVVYVTCGDPDLATTREVVIAAADAGADVIELGVPFSDPLADGPVIQRASQRAVEKGTTLAQVLKLAGEVRHLRPEVGLIIFSYVNPVMNYGIERFCQDANRVGVNGALLTDMTIEEADEYRSLMRAHGLATVFLVAPTSTDSRLKKIVQASQGFIYAVSRTGVTGPREQGNVQGEADRLVRRIRKFSKLPVAVGFGISSAEDFRAVGEYADAAVVGSAIVRIIEQNSGGPGAAAAVSSFIKALKVSSNSKKSAPKGSVSAKTSSVKQGSL